MIKWGYGSTEWWKYPLEKEIADISESGFSGLNLMSGHTGIFEAIRCSYGVIDNFLDDINEKNLEWASLYWYGKSLSDYEKQRYVIEETEMLSEFADYCKCRVLMVDVMHQGVTFDYPVTEKKIRIFSECLNKIGEATLKNNVKTVVHPHLNGLVENEKQLDFLMKYTSPEYVWVSIDSGQFYLGGSDPVKLVRKYGDRLALPHLKDAHSGFEAVDKRDWVHGKGWMIAKDFDDMFVWEKDRRYKNLGNGQVDLVGFVKAIKEVGYDGWIVTEADGEGCTHPKESAIQNRKYIKDNLEGIFS